MKSHLGIRHLRIFVVLITCASGVAQKNTPGMGPRLDVTNYGASGSDRLTYGKIGSGESSLHLREAADFKDGQGIKIEHAGLPCSLAGKPCPPGLWLKVKVEGDPGSTSYTYRLAVIDEHGGIGSAGPLSVILNASSSLGARSYNLVCWGPIPTAAAYALYRNDKLFTVISVLTPEGYYTPPRGPEFTSCYRDRGFPTISAQYPDIPQIPPTANLADSLVTAVVSGGGTFTLRLKDRAAASSENALVTHDDSEPIQAAFDAASAGGTVYFPRGRYLFTRRGFLINSSTIRVQGAGQTLSILQDNMAGNGFSRWVPAGPCGFLTSVSVPDLEISDLAFSGLSGFGSSMTRLKKAICGTGSFDRLYVHDVLARNISGEAIYADDSAPGQVVFSNDTVEDSAKNALNTNSASLATVSIANNTVRRVSGAAILVVSQTASVTGNHITGSLPSGSDVVNVATTKFFTVAGNDISGVDMSLAATSLIHVGFHGSKLNGGGIVAGNIIRDSKTLNESGGGAIFVDDLPGPVLIANNVIEGNGHCCQAGIPGISIANNTNKVLITGNTIRGSRTNQDVAIRVERSVPAANHILVGPNDIRAIVPNLFFVPPGTASEDEFTSLLRLAENWPRPTAKP